MRRAFLSVTVFGLLLCGSLLAGTAEYLPFGRSWVGDIELPNPIGLGVTFHHQNQNYNLSSIEVSIPGNIPDDMLVDNNITEMNIKLDCWLFPFANFFGILGDVQGETVVSIEDSLTQILLGTNSINVDISGMVYGGGLTVAVGNENIFAMVTSVLTGTRLEESESSISTTVLSPKGGANLDNVIFGQDITFWVGAMYQNTDESHSGTFVFEGLGDVEYEVELEDKYPWNYVAGLSTNFGRHLQLDIEGGFGHRNHTMGALSYRF